MVDWGELDANKDGGMNQLDIGAAQNQGQFHLIPYIVEAIQSTVNPFDVNGSGTVDTSDYLRILESGDTGRLEVFKRLYPNEVSQGEAIRADTTSVTGMGAISATQGDMGISSGAVGSRKELGRMLQSYMGRTSLIQGAQRQKAIFTVDRFDGGLNLNAAPRDLSYWEACQMDELSPAKIGRLIRLGDFTKDWDSSGAAGSTYAMGLETDVTEQENYGLHYFKWSDSITDSSDTLALAGGSPTNYLAYNSCDGGVDLWNFTTNDEVTAVMADDTFHDNYKQVYHSASNRLYVSDASFQSAKTFVCGIIDRPSYFPYTHTDGSLKYNVSAGAVESDADYYSILSTSQALYQAAPVAGINTAGTVCVSGHTDGFSNAYTTHQGIYILAQFEDISGDEGSSIGWGSSTNNVSKYYKFYASFLYDDGSETKLTDVTSGDNADGDVGDDKVTATTGGTGEYQKLVVRQVLIDVGSFVTAGFKRVHGARFYYTEVDISGNPIGSDKYLWAELDFRYGFKLVSEFGHWNLFEDEHAPLDGTLPTVAELQSLQVANAANTGTGTDADASSGNEFGTLEILSPPTAFTYYALNLFHQEEIKDDLMWKTSTVGNGIAFVANIKYDGREYPDTMLYSGAGETDAGSAYPMWGTFPVDSNRIDIPGAAGGITALKWISNRVLQFRMNSLYVINVEDVLAPSIEGVYQGMGVHGQWAVTETPFGCAWLNESGAYAYNAEEGKARSLTMGRLDTEDFGADSTSKIGYDDRAKMLIIGNYNRRATDNYHYAYSFVTDAWSTWNVNANSYTPMSNFAIDHEGYLTGGTRSSTNLIVNKWSASAQTEVAIDYITKDFDFGKPNLDKRFYTLYISFTGGANQASMFVYFRVNGMEGTDLANGWTKLGTIYDYTNPYGNSSGASWATDVSTINDLDVASSIATVTTSAAHGLSVGDKIYIDASNNTYDESVVILTVADSTHFTYATSQSDVANLTGTAYPVSGNAIVPTAVDDLDSTDTGDVQKLAKINLRHLGGSLPADYLKFARSIQFRINGTAAATFEINDISLVFKEKRIK